MHDEFLILLQAVESNRKCEGKDCLDITDGNIADAAKLERDRLHHLPTGDGSSHNLAGCVDCVAITGQEIALRETLHSQGIDLPTGIFEP